MRCEKCGYPLDGNVCPACKEEERKKIVDAFREKYEECERLGGRRAYEEFTLERFDNQVAIRESAEYPNNNLFIYGPAGTGKTHLATALVRRHNGRVMKPQEIYRSCRVFEPQAEQEAIEKYIRSPIIVIDDIGQEKNTEWSFSTLYEVVDGRYMAGDTGLIITSNLSLEKLAERFNDDRIVSRIAGMCKVVEISGPDRRLHHV